MRKHIIAASAVALLCSGAAFAQMTPAQTDTTTTTTTTPGVAASETPRAKPSDGVRGDRASAEALMGRTVIGADGKELGEVQDVILDADSGSARQVIIASGGFLGIGEKNIAVDFDDAKVLAGNDQIQVDSLTQAQVDKLEGYEYDRDTVSLSRGGASKPATSGTVGN